MADGPKQRSKPTGQLYLSCPALEWNGMEASNYTICLLYDTHVIYTVAESIQDCSFEGICWQPEVD